MEYFSRQKWCVGSERHEQHQRKQNMYILSPTFSRPTFENTLRTGLIVAPDRRNPKYLAAPICESLIMAIAN